MKTGKWNYTEDITYRVVNVRLAAVPEHPMYWQNAFAGETVQAVEITAGKHSWLIDNSDGSGLRKIERGGGPDSYSAHIDVCFEVLDEVPEAKWNAYDVEAHKSRHALVEAYQQKADPVEYEKLRAMKESFKQFKNAFNKP